jgi:hypothetical protein
MGVLLYGVSSTNLDGSADGSEEEITESIL